MEGEWDWRRTPGDSMVVGQWGERRRASQVVGRSVLHLWAGQPHRHRVEPVLLIAAPALRGPGEVGAKLGVAGGDGLGDLGLGGRAVRGDRLPNRRGPEGHDGSSVLPRQLVDDDVEERSVAVPAPPRKPDLERTARPSRGSLLTRDRGQKFERPREPPASLPLRQEAKPSRTREPYLSQEPRDLSSLGPILEPLVLAQGLRQELLGGLLLAETAQQLRSCETITDTSHLPCGCTE